MSAKNRKSNSLTGFALFELIMIMVILAILTIVATPRIADTISMRLDMAARNIQSDIRYTQSLAISIQRRTGVLFSSIQDRYSVYIEDRPGNWIQATDPLTREDFVVQLNTDEFAGIDLVLVYFNGFDRALIFDRWGNPYGYNFGSGVATPLNNPAGVRLRASSGTRKDIRVERGTGRAYIYTP